MNSPETVCALLERMLERGIRPEFEIFDIGMANYVCYLVDKYDLKGPFYANIMLGNAASAQADLLSIAAICAALPSDTIWGLGGMGNCQPRVTALATAVAPAVRVGLEDNLWADAARNRLTTNEDMVARIHSLAALSDRQIVTSAQLRIALQLSTGAKCPAGKNAHDQASASAASPHPALR